MGFKRPSIGVSTDQLRADLKHVTAAINVPFSEENFQKTLDVFEDNLRNCAVAFRTTDRPGDPVNFWAGEWSRRDTVSQAVNAGITASDHSAVLLLRSWFSMYNDEPEPSTDFDTSQGLAKTWIYFMRLRPTEEILNVLHVPQSFRNHMETFKRIGADSIYHVAVSYKSSAVNLYFHIPGPLTAERAEDIVHNLLPNCSLPTALEIEQMKRCTSPSGPTIIAVTISYPAGEIGRICFYGMGVSREVALELGIGSRLDAFWKATPCYDEQQALNFGWSFGHSGGRYLKMDIGYGGGFNEILKRLRHT